MADPEQAGAPAAAAGTMGKEKGGHSVVLNPQSPKTGNDLPVHHAGLHE